MSHFMESYLVNITWFVRLRKAQSWGLCCSFCIQLLLLISLLYTALMYMHSAYADDVQLYLHCMPSLVNTHAVDNLERCTAAIYAWMSSNRLKLNADKTELLWLGTSGNLRKLNDQGPSLSIAGSTVSPCTSVRLLGVTVTADLNLEKHVSNVCSKSFFQLRQLWKIRRSLDQVSSSTLVHAFVTSRVDYCSCLLAGSTDKIINKLQRIMNAAARVVTNTGKYEHGLSHLMHN